MNTVREILTEKKTEENETELYKVVPQPQGLFMCLFFYLSVHLAGSTFTITLHL